LLAAAVLWLLSQLAEARQRRGTAYDYVVTERMDGAALKKMQPWGGPEAARWRTRRVADGYRQQWTRAHR
jgi:hypothetical protein